MTTLLPPVDTARQSVERVDPSMSARSIRRALSPRTVAVIGASRTPGTIGYELLHNLITYGFTGAVYPVNPRAQSICCVKAYPSIAEVPDEVDLAMIVVPRDGVLDVVRQSVEARVGAIAVISAGFKELGPLGASMERDVLQVVRRAGIRMFGPNCLGVVNADPGVSMNATFVRAMPPFGHAAFVSQSGALGASVLDYAHEYGIGISQFVSVGNKADVSSNDLLLAWEEDPTVHVILMYVENFGNPRRFLEIASRITKTKPIIAVKSGRSRAGARAATSHTGALAASDTAVDALLTQAGVLRAASIEELFDMAMGFAGRALPRGRRTAVLTNAGGPGILAADALETSGLEVVDLAPETIEALRPLFPPEASIRNPLDMIASATPSGYNTALRALLTDPNVDAVVPIFVPPLGVRQEDVAEAIVAASNTVKEKPVLAVLMGRKGLPEGRAELHEAKIPAYIFPESAARALAALNRQREWAARPLRACMPVPVDREAARRILSRVRSDDRERLTEMEALDLVRAYGITTADARVGTDVDAACQAARAVGYPVVLKIVSPDIAHKSDVGGVQVDLASEAELRTAHERVMQSVRALRPEARITGVLVQRMVPAGRETIVGITRDAKFGALVMFGLGGMFVEAMRDVVFRVAPIDDVEAAAMVDGIRGAPILRGMRGEPGVDRAALADAVRRIAQLANDFPEILELDVNPLLAFASGVVAADARVTISPRA